MCQKKVLNLVEYGEHIERIDILNCSCDVFNGNIESSLVVVVVLIVL